MILDRSGIGDATGLTDGEPTAVDPHAHISSLHLCCHRTAHHSAILVYLKSRPYKRQMSLYHDRILQAFGGGVQGLPA